MHDGHGSAYLQRFLKTFLVKIKLGRYQEQALRLRLARQGYDYWAFSSSLVPLWYSANTLTINFFSWLTTIGPKYGCRTRAVFNTCLNPSLSGRYQTRYCTIDQSFCRYHAAGSGVRGRRHKNGSFEEEWVGAVIAQKSKKCDQYVLDIMLCCLFLRIMYFAVRVGRWPRN